MCTYICTDTCMTASVFNPSKVKKIQQECGNMKPIPDFSHFHINCFWGTFFPWEVGEKVIVCVVFVKCVCSNTEYVSGWGWIRHSGLAWRKFVLQSASKKHLCTNMMHKGKDEGLRSKGGGNAECEKWGCILPFSSFTCSVEMGRSHVKIPTQTCPVWSMKKKKLFLAFGTGQDRWKARL